VGFAHKKAKITLAPLAFQMLWEFGACSRRMKWTVKHVKAHGKFFPCPRRIASLFGPSFFDFPPV